MDWKNQLKHDAGFARDLMLKYGELTPMFMLHTEHGVKVVGTGWKNDEEKALTRRVIKLMAIAEGAHAISYICEAWERAVERRDDESEVTFTRRANAVRARDEHPERVEIVIVVIAYREDERRHTLGSSMAIVRDAAGKVADVVPRRDAEYGLGGEMTTLLTHATPSAIVREAAQDLLDALDTPDGTEGMTMQ